MQLVKSFAKAFELSSTRAVQPGKTFGCETWNFGINQCRLFSQRITNVKIRVANEPNDISGKGFIYRFTFASEDFMRARKANLFASACVNHTHIALKFARANTNKGQSIAMLRIHVGLDLENES